MVEQAKKKSKYTTIGYIRVKRNNKTQEPFYTVSFDVGELTGKFQGLMRINKDRLAEVLDDDTQLGNTIVGNLLFDPTRKTGVGSPTTRTGDRGSSGAPSIAF